MSVTKHYNCLGCHAVYSGRKLPTFQEITVFVFTGRISYLEDEGSAFLWQVDLFLPDNMASYPRWELSSAQICLKYDSMDICWYECAWTQFLAVLSPGFLHDYVSSTTVATLASQLSVNWAKKISTWATFRDTRNTFPFSQNRNGKNTNYFL
jgi:hypothetical protein